MQIKLVETKYMLSYLSRYTTLRTVNIIIAEIIDNFAVLCENVYSYEQRSAVLDLVDMSFKSSITVPLWPDLNSRITLVLKRT
jgi:hypothetical protein